MARIIIAVIGAFALLLTACEAPEVTTEPDPADEAADDEDGELPEEEPEELEEDEEEEIRAQVGDSITLRGSDADLEVRVAVTEIFDPAEAEEFMEPSEGNRYVAVDLELENVGEINYEDSPGNGAILIDEDNRQHQDTFVDVPDCQGFGGMVTMAPGDTRAGCVVFEVPEDMGLRNFQFALDSGFAPQKGIWELGG